MEFSNYFQCKIYTLYTSFPSCASLRSLTYTEASHHSHPSPDGLYIATLLSTRLQIRSSRSLATVRTISLPPDFASHIPTIRWSHVHRPRDTSEPQHTHPARNNADPTGTYPLRILLATDTTLRIWTLHDPASHATINLPSKPASVAFGHTSSQILVFSDFGLKLTIWFLNTGKSVEIRDPKPLPHGNNHTYRPGTGHLALLTRPGAQDVVTLHAQDSYDVVGGFKVPVVDAQGIKWSPDGRWLVVWEAASAGLKVLVYTADGHLYRVYRGGEHEDGDGCGLSVRGVEWSPGGQYLAVLGSDGKANMVKAPDVLPR